MLYGLEIISFLNIVFHSCDEIINRNNPAGLLQNMLVQVVNSKDKIVSEKACPSRYQQSLAAQLVCYRLQLLCYCLYIFPNYVICHPNQKKPKFGLLLKFSVWDL